MPDNPDPAPAESMGSATELEGPAEAVAEPEPFEAVALPVIRDDPIRPEPAGNDPGDERIASPVEAEREAPSPTPTAASPPRGIEALSAWTAALAAALSEPPPIPSAAVPPRNAALAAIMALSDDDKIALFS
jgi:hypothetical protein